MLNEIKKHQELKMITVLIHRIERLIIYSSIVHALPLHESIIGAPMISTALKPF